MLRPRYAPSVMSLLIGLIVGGCPGTWPEPPSPIGPFSKLVVFGDSLSDVGNDFSETCGLAPRPPYSGGRFSNGRLWIQHLADHYGLPLTASRQGGTDFAYGGAQTGTGRSLTQGVPLAINMRTQLAQFHDPLDGDELIVVWGGANDLFDDLNDGGGVSTTEMATDIALIIIELYGRGGRHFVVPNLPEFGDLPFYYGTPQEAYATEMSAAFNTAVATWLDRIADFPDLELYRPDVAAFFNEAIANLPPPLTNSTEPAWTGNYLGFGGELSTEPDAHVFWDHVHPSRISHELLGAYVHDLIDAQLEN